MQKLLLLLLMLTLSVFSSAQLIITDPAAPTDDQAVTITFDATQGTAGLANCNCDVYLHTGILTQNSTNSGDWQYVQTQWGVANDDWKLTPVAGEDNLYTYTFEPSIREYFDAPASEEIKQIAFVFRNADGSLEGKASGGADIFVDVSEGGELGLTLSGDPGNVTWPLGKPLPILAGATQAADFTVFDNGVPVATGVGVELSTDLVFTESGRRTVTVVATAGNLEVRDSFTVNTALVVDITNPVDNINPGIVGQSVSIIGTNYIEADVTITDGSGVIYSATVEDFNQSFVLPDESILTYTITAEYRGERATDVVSFVIGGPTIAEPPVDERPGAVNLSDESVLFQLRAPGKQDVFVIGDFNDWTPTAAGRMNRSANDTTFWLQLDSLDADQDLLYQYLIDGDIVQPDPYSTLVLDPNNDPFITDDTFEDIPDYPGTQTEGIVSWMRRGVDAYEWETPLDYEGRPDPKKMVVYELLLRDFIEKHDFATLTDSLDYLERLGVNAIELMPVNEFEGNLSWGYNPSFHMALDKYYGSPEDLKALVDAAHARGMAVIVDVVYNHAFGQSPLARMWWNEQAFRPTPDNPYLNVEARHPFNVGYDFNHESALTKEYVKVTTEYWLEEFRLDGFRWDLSKGFTQRQSNDVGAWNQYDAERIAILKDYADHVWSVNDDAYMIMEHLGVRQEEEELAQYGNDMYFWSGFNPHNAFLEASMGYPASLNEVLPGNRGFSDRNLISYMESHDEERMQYKNLTFGNSAGEYTVRNESEGLDRVELASTFFYTVPGPKMLWQFGELGYDFSINYCPNDGSINNNCRTDNKPIRWDYREDPDRQSVYNWIADLNYLRNNYDIFHGSVDEANVGSNNVVKYLRVSGTDGTAVIVGNFGVEEQTTNVSFPFTGIWYNYRSEDPLEVTSGSMSMTLDPGEFHVYLDRDIERGGGNIGTSTNRENLARLQLEALPNPTAGSFQLSFNLPTTAPARVDLLDVSGRQLRTLFRGNLPAGPQSLPLDVNGVPGGVYFLRVADGVGSGVLRIVKR